MALRLLSIIFITTALVGVRVDGTSMPGGLSEEKPPTPELQKILNSLKSEVAEKLGRPVEQLTLLSYKTQVVSGINYFAKVDLGDNDVVHLRVYRGFDQSVSLSAVQDGKVREDPISYF